MNHTGFYKLHLPLESNLFEELEKSIDFEEVTIGRKGNNLVDISDKGVPIVRTTTKHTKPAHNFSATHHMIAESIKNATNSQVKDTLSSIEFNNAMIEVYTQEYYKMGFHSDQCLDLEANSYIALFSCYEHPSDLSADTMRKLKVKNKATEVQFELTLEHNSVVLFSLATNSQFSHKIVLDIGSRKNTPIENNRWLGITFRKSKTYVNFKEDLPYFADGTRLMLANKTQRKEFYKLRGQENRSLDFAYPTLNYTLSQADMISPKV